jgi:hypothetical protein
MSIKRLSGAGLTTPKSNKLWDQVTFQSGMFAIATVSLTTTAASVAFTGIPNTYTHLQLRWIGKDNRGAASDGVNMTFNGDNTSGNYYGHRFYGDGAAANSQNFAGFSTGWINGSSSGSIFGACVVDILDYTSSTSTTNKFKTCKVFGGNDINGGGEAGFYSLLWKNSADAITSITLSPSNGSAFNAYSHFALYGIKAA